ncbi:hypothetical protein CIAN88_24070 [[Clostridium] innocuum]|uniref:Uncharacterized protein n=2 Tax=Clostridium innocuum TaxID=1522 RepID=A0A099HZ03_CLOIN|nr:hypothetical protein CIAN88_24070 [[Clostridium] innocuum]
MNRNDGTCQVPKPMAKNASDVNFGTSASISQTIDMQSVAILYNTHAWQNLMIYEDENFQLLNTAIGHND